MPDQGFQDAFDYSGSLTVNDVRYLEYVLESTGDGTNAIVVIEEAAVELKLRFVTDQGVFDVSASDSGGTLVPFNANFIDINRNSIVVSPQGTIPLQAVVDFQDIPNPTGFLVYLYDRTGLVRQSGKVNWLARGFI